ncbi:UNVERIFIED_ORG: putative membrane protein, partial [Clostridioides difficile Y384]
MVKFQIENYVFHKVYLLNFFIISFTIDYIINKI